MNNSIITALSDRRTNPHVRTKQRRRFDRRTSYRVGTSATALFLGGGNKSIGLLKDISESGACLEVYSDQKISFQSILLDIPFLERELIDCQINWSRIGKNNGNGGTSCYGVKFVDLNNEEKTHLWKRFLLDDVVLESYSSKLTRKAEDFQKKKEIYSFFSNDIKITIERLIDIENMILKGVNVEIVMQHCRDALNALLEAGDNLETNLNSGPLMKQIKQSVRALLGHFLFQSINFKHGFEKPRGYPGDYEMLEVVYDDLEISKGLGKYIDRYGLDVPYSIGIRARKDLMKEILYRFLNNNSEKNLSIMNLASGGCRELREMFGFPITYRGKAEIICIDQDEESIKFSRQQLSDLNTKNVHIHFIQGDILRLESLDIGEDNSFDMIYSIGVADYLQDRILAKIFKDCYRKLKPGGKLIVAYKDKDVHKPLALNWYADWCFVPRNEQDVVSLIYDSIGRENISLEIKKIDSGVIFFAEIIKLGHSS